MMDHADRNSIDSTLPNQTKSPFVNAIPIDEKYSRPSMTAFESSFRSAPTNSRTASSTVATVALIKFTNLIRLKVTHIEYFKIYHYLALIMNILYVIAELMGLYSFASNPDAYMPSVVTLLFLALFFSLVDTVIIILLIYRRSKSLCVVAFICMLLTDIMYGVQTGILYDVYYSTSPYFQAYFAFCIVALCAQAFPLLVIYRYWEYLMYNYDPAEEGIHRNRKSLADIHGRDSAASVGTEFSIDVVLNKISGSNSIVSPGDLNLSGEFTC